MRIIDTHLHLIDRERLRYPWLASVPALDRDFPLATYAQEARRCGVTDALHMEVDVAEDQIEAETRHVGELGAEFIRGAISACRPENEDFPAFLERQAGNAFVKGFRRVLHTEPDELSRSPRFRENLARVRRPFDLCVRADQLTIGAELVDACPDVSFVLDHCGVPDIAARAEHPWRQHIADLARRPNVAAKISGVVAYADAHRWTLDDIKPYVEHTIASFGWDRVVFGGDWPVCTLTSSLSGWLAALQAIVAGGSVEEREKLFAGNARRIWGLP